MFAGVHPWHSHSLHETDFTAIREYAVDFEMVKTRVNLDTRQRTDAGGGMAPLRFVITDEDSNMASDHDEKVRRYTCSCPPEASSGVPRSQDAGT